MAVRDLMALQARARLVAVVLLGLTLAVGVMVGRAWDVVGSSGDGDAALETATAPLDAAAAEGDSTAPAPEERAGGGPGGRSRGPVIYEVGLDDSQRAAVDEIVRHFRTSMRALNEEARRDYDRRESALLEATRDSIRAVLDADQIARYDSLLAARYSSGRDGGGSPRRERRRDGPR